MDMQPPLDSTVGRIQNVHAHVWDPCQHLSRSVLDAITLARGKPLELAVSQEAYLQEMSPFDKVVVFGMKAKLSGFWVPDEYVGGWVRACPDKLLGFASCDPTQPDALDELREGVETHGLVGVKIAPMYAGVDPRDERCRAVYDYCQERGLPVLFHAGTTFIREAPLGVTRPWLFDEVAIRYPELRIVLAHLGHPFEGECIAVIRKHPHVFADLSALFYRPWQFYNMLLLAQEYGVTHKLLFGTDFPFAGSVESIEGLRNINAIIGSATLPRVTDEAINGILNRNALALLGLAS